MIIQRSKDKPLQFDANLEKIIRTSEKRSKNNSCEWAILYIHTFSSFIVLNMNDMIDRSLDLDRSISRSNDFDRSI
jgi:hypothetical protein